MKTPRCTVALLLVVPVVATVLAGCERKATSPGDNFTGSTSASNSATASSTRDAFERRYGLLDRPQVFGPHWDSVPPPTITDSNSMAAVEAFVATNGWNMSPGVLFGWGLTKTKPIGGLPWVELKGREFPAVTSGGILYVVLDSWHHDGNGIAYNPKTNRFDKVIAGFKPLGNHWYAWGQPEDPITLAQQYEGTNR